MKNASSVARTAPVEPKDPLLTAHSDEQLMLALSLVSYVGFYEPTVGDHAAQSIHEALQEALDSIAWLKDWQIVWGPAVHRLPLVIFDENLMFVVRSRSAPQRYAVVIRGTNPVSWTNWLLQDFAVLRQTAWPYAKPESAPDAKLSRGTARGLQALQAMTPMPGLPGGGLPLQQFLAQQVTELDGAALELSVTGHSLGGALAPTLALWLKDTQQVSDRQGSPPWDPSERARFSVCAFAGPSPGNRAFSQYYAGRLGAHTQRIYNPLDVVPHAWIASALRKLPRLYAPKVRGNLAAWIASWFAPIAAELGDYEHLLPDAPPLAGSEVDTVLRNYALQMAFQHTVAYPELLDMANVIDPSIYCRVSGRLEAVLAAQRAKAVLRSGEKTLSSSLEGPVAFTDRLLSELSRLYKVPASLLFALLPKAAAHPGLKERSRAYHGS